MRRYQADILNAFFTRFERRDFSPSGNAGVKHSLVPEITTLTDHWSANMLPKLFTHINVNKCSGSEGLTLNSNNNNNNYKKKKTGDFYSTQSRAESWGTMRSQKNAEWITYIKTKTKRQIKHTITTTHWTIVQSTTAKKVDSPETTNCTNVHKHIIK